jgi:pyrroloquinoline quinone biosynthesis protein B
MLVILGTVQDAGSPHPGCKKDCCKDLFLHPDPDRKITSLGLIDPVTQKKFLIEATPDMPFQMKNLLGHSPFGGPEAPDGIVVTHAHIGHYTGLMYLGREAMNTRKVPVFAMPSMQDFLENNGPWSQLVKLENIEIRPLADNQMLELTPNLKVTPFLVPHRDEFSETIGLIIEGPSKKVLFIPDIDKWDKWETDIIQAIAGVDYALIDGTFYDAAEISGRNIAEIPHPFIIESMERFRNLPEKERNKIWFIHLNHTNPALNPKSLQTKTIVKNGFHVARMNQEFDL